MQYFSFSGPDALTRARAEIKARLLSSASPTARPQPVPPDSGYHAAQARAASGSGVDPNAEAGDAANKPPLPAAPQSEAADPLAPGDDEATDRHFAGMKWIEPVFVEPVAAGGSADVEWQAHTEAHAVASEAVAQDLPPEVAAAHGSVDGGSAGPAHIGEAGAPSALPRPARFRWGRRSAGSAEAAPGIAAYSKESAAERDAVADEVIALRRILAAERAAAAARIAALEAALSAERKAASDEDELRAALAAAADEIANLRNTMTAEREAAADEIATLRTILAAQQEAAIARTARIEAVLGVVTPSPAASD